MGKHTWTLNSYIYRLLNPFILNADNSDEAHQDQGNPRVSEVLFNVFRSKPNSDYCVPIYRMELNHTQGRTGQKSEQPPPGKLVKKRPGAVFVF